MPVDVTMPQMGESVVEGTIARWLVKEGDSVREDQPLVEISTDKVDTEIPSPGAGVIARIVAHEGETVAVGAKIAEITEAGVPSAARQATVPAAVAAPVEPAPIAPGKPEPQSAVATSHAEISLESALEAPRRYSPVVMKMAADYRINLERVTGTGLGGRVTKRDLLKYLESLGHKEITLEPSREGGAAGQAVAVAPSAPPEIATGPPAHAVRAMTAPAGTVFRPPLYGALEGDTVEPFTRRRKLIAEHMVYSKTHSPHVGTVAEVDLSRALAIRDAHKEDFRRREGFALTLLPLVAAATVHGLREFPRMNASVAGDSLIIRKQINLGIAMDDEEGLLVPVIKSAEGMSVTGLAREIERMRRKIAERQLSADDLAGGSFTLSNPGREGNLYGFAIINQPQVGILRMGEIKKRVVVTEDGGDAIAIRPMMYLALSYDHRVVDGVLGNRFLHRVARLIEGGEFEL